MSFEPHNLCVTGGAGFIGANFVRHWLNRSREGRVVVFDALTYAGNLDNLAGLDPDPRYEFVRGDICDEDAVRELIEKYAIDTIVHFAAESHVDRSILGPDDFIRTNVVGTHALLKTAKRLWIDQRIAMRRSASRLPTRRIRRIPPARRARTTWCAPITKPTGSRPRSPIARTTTGPTSFPRN